ncbi:MAG: hypothetical protein AAB628_00060 [Patescibacteria group bacterium]
MIQTLLEIIGALLILVVILWVISSRKDKRDRQAKEEKNRVARGEPKEPLKTPIEKSPEWMKLLEEQTVRISFAIPLFFFAALLWVKDPEVYEWFWEREWLFIGLICLGLFMLILNPNKWIQKLLWLGVIVLFSMITWEHLTPEQKPETLKNWFEDTEPVAVVVGEAKNANDVIAEVFTAKPGVRGVLEIPSNRDYKIRCSGDVVFFITTSLNPEGSWYGCNDSNPDIRGDIQRFMFTSNDREEHSVFLKHGPVGVDPQKLR